MPMPIPPPPAAPNDRMRCWEPPCSAFEGLKTLVARFWEPDRAYVSRSAPQFVHDYAGDYGHLARVFEWSTSGADEGEGEA